MTKFAFCDNGSLEIWQVDTANPSPLPLVVHHDIMTLTSIAWTADQQFQTVWGDRQIRKTTGASTNSLVYSVPAAEEAKVWFLKVRVRNIAAGLERVYFSATSLGPDYQHIKIYYLDNTGTAKLYTTIDAAQVTVPNPCNPSAPELPYYVGDFAFGDGNTLYLSTGNCNFAAGIYRIEGAGPDSVTGPVTVERIYLGDGPIQGLCYHSPQTLYFLRDDNVIYKLDLTDMSESAVASVPTYPGSTAWDLTEIPGKGFKYPFSSIIFGHIYKLLMAVAALAFRLATHTHQVNRQNKGIAPMPGSAPTRKPR